MTFHNKAWKNIKQQHDRAMYIKIDISYFPRKKFLVLKILKMP